MTSDATWLCEAGALDVLVDATGAVEFGANSRSRPSVTARTSC